MSQHLAAVHVADSVDAQRGGLQIVVHHDVAAQVDLDPRVLQPDPGRVGLPPHRHQDLLGGDLRPIGQLGRHVVVGVLADALHLGLEQHLDAALAVCALELLGQAQVFQRQHLGKHLHHGDLDAEFAVERGELAADDPGPHDEQGFRDLLQG